MRCLLQLFLLSIGVLCTLPASSLVAAPKENLADQLQVPDHFRVTTYATDDLAHSIYAMTVNPRGQIVVSGRDYIRTLIDADNDGQAESFIEFAPAPEDGVQGLCFDGEYLYCVGGEAFLRYRDQNQDGKADGLPQKIIKINTGGEHDAHAIRKGPDGWWYLLAGNSSGVTSKYASLKSSPITSPSAGVLLRIRPKLNGAEILADGFRNAYDFDFGPYGDLFVYDSDGERDITLPWYRPTRLYQLRPGTHAGWISRSWKHPSSYPEMPNEVGSFGRGSPTGVINYRHSQFPPQYQNGLFILDWTYGRVHAIPLERDGSAIKSEPELFMSAKGSFGFAPTDAVVGPEGALFVSIGGRGTQGTVFKVEYQDLKTPSTFKPAPQTKEQKLLACLEAPQPLSSWSRDQWEPIASSMGRTPFDLVLLNSNQKYQPAHQLRAIEILKEKFAGISVPMVDKLSRHSDPEIRARAIWGLGEFEFDQQTSNLFDRYLLDNEPVVVYQALQRLRQESPNLKVLQQFAAGLILPLGSPDRFVRESAIQLITTESKQLQSLWENLLTGLPHETVQRVKISLASAGLRHHWQQDPSTLDDESLLYTKALETGSEVLADSKLKGEAISVRLFACRLLQQTLGDMGPRQGRDPLFDGYASRLELGDFEQQLDPVRIELAKLFPTGDQMLDEELSRLLSMLSPYNPKLLQKMLDQIDEASSPSNDIHYLTVASRIPVRRTLEQLNQIANALLNIERKVKDQNLPQDNNWNDRMKELYEALIKSDPRLPIEITLQPTLGLAGHVLFMSEVPPEFLEQGIAKFVKNIEEDPDFKWSNEVIFALGRSAKPEIRQLIREQFDSFATRQAVLMHLSEAPQPEELELFVKGLEVSHLPALESAVSGLKALQAELNPGAIVEIYRAARRLTNSSAEFKIRENLMKLLQDATKQDFGFQLGEKGYRLQSDVFEQWENWLTENYPEAAQKLKNKQSSEATELLARLELLDWEKGDASNGEKLFQSLGCAQCHKSMRALGPDLAGVSNRFSRKDLFEAIVLPSLVVSPRYQANTIVTQDGKVYTGLVVYGSVDGMILRDSLSQTHRIETRDIEEQIKSTQSLMPTGLLNDLTEQEVVDLYQYLKQLQ